MIKGIYSRSVKTDVLPVLLFVFLLSVLAATLLQQTGFLPVWDGWVFFRCFQNAWADRVFSCDGHSSLAVVGLFSLPQLVFPGSVIAVQGGMLLLMMAGLLVMRAMLAGIFRERLSAVEISLGVFLVGFNPLVMVHVLQPSLDLPLAIFGLLTLAALMKERFILAAVGGMLMVFTKETGVAWYGISLLAYGIGHVAVGKRTPVQSGRSIFTSLIPLVAPFAAMAIYVWQYPPFPHWSAQTETWTAVFLRILMAPQFDSYFIGQATVLGVINFTWIMTTVIAVALPVVLKQWAGHPGIRRTRHVRVILTMTVILVLQLLLSSRIKFFNNPRYVLPLLPVFVTLFLEALTRVVPHGKPRVVFICTMLLLLYLSYFRTIDPVARLVYGIFPFGSHSLLAMSRFTNPAGGYGKDELVYNTEFMELPLLTERLIQAVGEDKTYIVHDDFTWTSLGLDDYKYIDPDSGKRTLKGDLQYAVRMITSKQAFVQPVPEAYFILYPNMHNQDVLQALSSLYSPAEMVMVEHRGYRLQAVQLVRK